MSDRVLSSRFAAMTPAYPAPIITTCALVVLRSANGPHAENARDDQASSRTLLNIDALALWRSTHLGRTVLHAIETRKTQGRQHNTGSKTTNALHRLVQSICSGGTKWTMFALILPHETGARSDPR